MQAADTVLEQWVDIPTLPAPDSELSLAVILLLGFIVTVVILLVRLLPGRQKASSCRKLRRLQTDREGSREQLSELHQILLTGLTVEDLKQKDFGELQPQWKQFHQELERYRFQQERPTSEEVSRLVEQAISLLRRV